MKIILLVPAYNAKPWSQDFNEKISSTAFRLKEEFKLDTHLVFVDDGSLRIETQVECHLENLKQIKNCSIHYTRHHLNRGQGAAIMTALKIGRDFLHGDFFVTIDSDEQHNPLNIPILLEYLIANRLNIVFGNRFAAKEYYIKQIPIFRKLLLKLAVKFERFLAGLDLADAHNGLRVFDKKAAEILEIKQDRMAHATEIKKLVHNNKLAYGECEVQISYNPHTLENGQKSGNAINIIQELIREKVF